MNQRRYVETRRRGRTAEIVLTRDEKLNALDSGTLRDLTDTLRNLYAEDEVGAIVLHGGPRALAAGADLAELADMGPNDFVGYGRRMVELVSTMWSGPKPIVTAVEGLAFGGGNALCLASDLVVAARGARFGQQEIHVGLLGGAWMLPRLVGRQRAAEIVMLGEPYSAEEAHAMGLVNRVVPDGTAVTSAHELAASLASKSPEAMAFAKRALGAAWQVDPVASLSGQLDMMAIAFDTDTRRAAMASFLGREGGA